MDAIVASPLNDQRAAVQDINIIDTTHWNNTDQGISSNNSTLVYIAVSIAVFYINNTKTFFYF